MTHSLLPLMKNLDAPAASLSVPVPADEPTTCGYQRPPFRILCGGVHNGIVFLSARTNLANAGAGELLRTVVGKLGRAGGHDRRAGGSIKLPSPTPSAFDELQATLRKRLLKKLS